MLGRMDAPRDIADPALLDWCLHEAPSIDGLEPLLLAYIDRLRIAGVPLDRMRMYARTLHPQLAVAAYRWEAGKGIEAIRISHEMDLRPTFLNSPVHMILDGGDGVRRRLTGENETLDFPVLQDLRDEGFTDYLVLPAGSSGKTANAVTYASRGEGGFSEADIAILKLGMKAIAGAIEIQALRLLAGSVVETYLGRRTGARVLDGKIKRGDLETIDAILWHTDLRGFTELSETCPPETVITLLNEYFDVVGGAVENHGGEVLKFMGDAMLAIVPLEADQNPEAATDAALAAAREAMDRAARVNEQRAVDCVPLIRFGIAVHIGSVGYGNIGVENRLDFTVIGPPVNLVSRIGSLCGTLDQRFLASEAFAAAASPDALVACGDHSLKGIDQPVTVFKLREGPP